MVTTIPSSGFCGLWSLDALTNVAIYRSTISKISRKLLSPVDEAILQARKISFQTKSVPKLFLSGGIDSEAMAESFLLAKIQFTVVIGRYNNNQDSNSSMNDHDISHAFEFCEKHNLSYEVIDLDVFSFLESEKYLEYGKKYGCRSPQLAVHLYMLDQVEGDCFVLGGNPIFPVFEKEQIEKLTDFENFRTSLNPNIQITTVVGLPSQLYDCYLKYFQLRNLKGTPFFFQSSSELMMSFLNLDTATKQLAANYKIHTYPDKCTFYKEAGFLCAAKPNKYTGFEKYREHYDQLHSTQHGVSFDRLFRRPLEEMNPWAKAQINFSIAWEVLDKVAAILATISQSTHGHKNINRRKFSLRLVQAGLASIFIPNSAQAYYWCCDINGQNCYSVPSVKDCPN